MLFFVGSWNVKITRMSVPRMIENGTMEAVILDCDYTFSDAERFGLVVKWYLNHDPAPVYQWIPRQKPQDLGVLRSRLNLRHRASTDPYKKHRALDIIYPTSDLSGTYTCEVTSLSSYDGEHTMSKEMTVYGKLKYTRN